MAWGARPGLKPILGTLNVRMVLRLNGLGSPSGIETGFYIREAAEYDRG